MLAALSKLRDVVQSHTNGQVEKQGVEQHLHRLQEQLTYVEEAQSEPQHLIYSLGLRYGEFAVVKASRLEVQQAIQEKLNELEHWHKLHEVSACFYMSLLNVTCGRNLGLVALCFVFVMD